MEKSYFDRDVYPYGEIGLWYFTFGDGNLYYCTAIQIAADVILTATHCVWDCALRKWLTGGTFFDRQYGPGDSYVDLTGYTRAVAWTSCDSEDKPIYDFAVVRLYRALPKKAYPLVAYSTANAVKYATMAFTISYPAETKSGDIPWLSYKTPFTAKYAQAPQ